jgi:agmatine/peptidylarginine deiminase
MAQSKFTGLFDERADWLRGTGRLNDGLRSAILLGVLIALSNSTTLASAEVLPRYQTAEEKLFSDGPSIDADFFIWECLPELAGFTPAPPVGSRFPTESEQTGGVLYGWPIYGCDMPELTELIRNSIRRVPTTVLVSSSMVDAMQACLSARGFTADDLALINLFQTELDGIWIRDYGPEVIVDPAGVNQFIDMGYYSGPAPDCQSGFPGRPNDDVSPTLHAPFFQTGVSVYRPQLRTEGGNLQTDGNGTCVHMQREVLAQNNFSRWQYTQAQLDDVYTQFYKCGRVITLRSLQSDPVTTDPVIDHVDMFVTFISQRKVLIDQYDPADAAVDSTNAGILDANAATMQAAGYTVVRIPTPRRHCTLFRPGTCIAQPGDTRLCTGPSDVRVWATYANSIRVGNAMMVPVYRDVPPSLSDAIAAQEATALATYQRELDTEFGAGVVQVVPVVSDAMIPCQGSVHCISMTYK